MSTRANVKMLDSYNTELWFYRHSDGYPEGTLPTLKQFMRRVERNQYRNNVQQAGGWLIFIGYEEYKEYQPDWKVGAYEPTTQQHGDIEYLYEVDLKEMEIRVLFPDGSKALEPITDFSKKEEED